MNIFKFAKTLCLLFVISISSITFADVNISNVKPVKYVFFFIGDGMGDAQRQITEAYSKTVFGKTLAMNDMPFGAETTTTLANGGITDSAAAATALACGVKAKKAALGLDLQDNVVSTCAEDAHKAGKKVGIISTCPINHATPAGFYSHSKSRGDMKLITQQALDSGFEFFAGGSFIDHYSYKVDGNKDIFDAAKDRGYKIARNHPNEFFKISAKDKKVIASYHIPYTITNSKYSPTLADFVSKAIEVLDNPNGFFIMCEGGMIDWVCHANDTAGVIFETLAFDDSVRVAVDFAKKHPDDTLIIVTGDHETGALDIIDISKLNPKLINRQPNNSSSFGSSLRKSAKKMKDKFAFEFAMMRVEEFFYFNSSQKTKITKSDIEQLRQAFYVQFSKNFSAEIKMSEKEKLDNKYEFYKNFKYPFDTAVVRTYGQKMGLNWTSNSHSKRPLLTTAVGKNAELFQGKIDNTDVGKILKAVVVKK